MSTSADTRESARKPAPIYKRRRRRIYGSLAAAAIVVIAVIVWAVTRSGGSGGALPGFTIAYGQGTVANSDSIIDSDAALAKTIPAHLHFVPFDAGVTAIAEMRSGSLQAISGVGNPPGRGRDRHQHRSRRRHRAELRHGRAHRAEVDHLAEPAGRQVRSRPGGLI